MINDAITVSKDLDRLAKSVRMVEMQAESDDQRRYLASSAELIEREHGKLAHAIASDDEVAIAWALRSIADMMKGLIDIGSDLPNLAPSLWSDAKNVAQQAHDIERRARRP